MTKDQADFVASELRRLAPCAQTPEGGTSHDGRRAFIAAAEQLESVLWSRPLTRQDIDEIVGGPPVPSQFGP